MLLKLNLIWCDVMIEFGLSAREIVDLVCDACSNWFYSCCLFSSNYRVKLYSKLYLRFAFTGIWEHSTIAESLAILTLESFILFRANVCVIVFFLLVDMCLNYAMMFVAYFAIFYTFQFLFHSFCCVEIDVWKWYDCFDLTGKAAFVEKPLESQPYPSEAAVWLHAGDENSR